MDKWTRKQTQALIHTMLLTLAKVSSKQAFRMRLRVGFYYGI